MDAPINIATITSITEQTIPDLTTIWKKKLS